MKYKSDSNITNNMKKLKIDLFEDVIEELNNEIVKAHENKYCVNFSGMSTSTKSSKLNLFDNIEESSKEFSFEPEIEDKVKVIKQSKNNCEASQNFICFNLAQTKTKKYSNMFKQKLLNDDHLRPKPIKQMLLELKQEK